MLAHRRASILSRTSSTTSVDSDDGDNTTHSHRIRRTRRRFSDAQLTVLDELYHKTSHPSREQREIAARTGRMEIKSVTIWFQNKRQMERKGALSNSTNHYDPHARPPKPYTAPRPSLDVIASRIERVSPVTPPRHNPHALLWDNMPSSPAAPPTSPPPTEFVEFGRLTRTRTLEWACARSRLVDKENNPLTGKTNAPTLARAVTWSAGDTIKWTSPMFSGRPDEDMLGAALALCGLGRGL